MSCRWVTVAAAAATFGGCAGGSFHVEPELAAAAHETIVGPPYAAGDCQTARQTGIERVADGSTTRAGDLTLVTGAALIDVDIRSQISPAVFEKLGALEAKLGGSSLGTAEPPATHQEATAGDLIAAIIAILGAFDEVTENAALPFVVHVHDRPLAGLCKSVNHATTMGVFDPPDFKVTCELAAGDGKRRTLQMHGSGSWANYAFTGTLTGGARAWTIASQNVSVMGAGGIRGFEVRAGKQVGAVSYYEQGPLDPANHATVVSTAWHAATGSEVDDDVLRSTIALLYAFPWPTSCDRTALAARPFPGQ